VITLLFYAANVDVTILVSKKSGRYRLQSGSFEALNLVAEELVSRLTKQFQKDGENEPFRIGFNEQLPFPDYFALIDRHFFYRQQMADLSAQLEKAALQFRLVQKRLLVRFKDKNPTPLGQLDVLLTDSYNQILTLVEAMDEASRGLFFAANHLTCGTGLMLQLIRFKYQLDSENFENFRNYLPPAVSDSIEQGWEETTNASLTHLLWTSLAKSTRDTSTVAQPLVLRLFYLPK
jgi:Bardet-Biedl syndrome 9 protein